MKGLKLKEGFVDKYREIVNSEEFISKSSKERKIFLRIH